MIVQFRKWGNSLAVRIPKSLANAINARDGKQVELTLKNGALVLQPLTKPKPKRRYSLDELLAGMTRDNVPEEVTWGPPRGNEVW
jgi:antitoxin MazE